MKKKLLIMLFLPLMGFSQLISEDFEGGIPDTWSLAGDGDWIVSDLRWELEFGSNVALLDDDGAGEATIISDAQLLSPVVDALHYTNLNLSFDYSNYIYELDSSLNVEVFDGTGWVNILSVVGDAYDPDTFLPLSTTIDVTAYANDQFQVRFIYNDGGDWSFGAVVDNVVLTGDLGVGDLTAANATGIYPNPAHGSFNIKAGDFFNAENLQVSVCDISGKTVKTYTSGTSYDVSDLAAGLYVVNITDGNFVEKRKLVIK